MKVIIIKTDKTASVNLTSAITKEKINIKSPLR